MKTSTIFTRISLVNGERADLPEAFGQEHVAVTEGVDADMQNVEGFPEKSTRLAVRGMVKSMLGLQSKKSDGTHSVLPETLQPTGDFMRDRHGMFMGVRLPDNRVSYMKFGTTTAEKMAKRTKAGELSANDVSLLTGTCLFAAHEAYAVAANGRRMAICDPRDGGGITMPVEHLDISDAGSMYESELRHRNTPLIRAMRDHPTLRRTFMHVPRVEYYLYVLDAVNRGFLPSALALEWFDAVDGRADAVRDAWRADVGGDLDCETPLAGLRGHIRTEVTAGRTIEPKDLAMLLAESDTPFTPAIRRMLATDQVNQFKDINHLGYCAEHMRLAANGPTIAVAPPEQEKILTNVTRVAPDLARNIVSMYVHAQVVAPQRLGLYVLPRLTKASRVAVLESMQRQYLPIAPVTQGPDSGSKPWTSSGGWSSN